MPKLDYLQQKKLNPADELRAILGRLEETLPTIKTLAAQPALDLLLDLDRLDALFQQLESAGLDLLPERGRFHSLQARLRKQAGPLLQSLGGATVLQTQRPAPAPPPENWWWYLDHLVAERQRQLKRQIALIGVIILAVIGGVILLFNTVLAPSPEVAARLEAENSAFEAIEAGQYEAALAFIRQGLQKVPGEPNLLLLQGVVQEMGDDKTSAAASFDQAQARLNNPLDFYLARSQLYLRLGQPGQAETDARTALELDDNRASVWLLLGQTLENQQKMADALLAYQKANELAIASGDSEIIVMARLALARIGGMP
ncbi:MAG: hypothetical protein Fur0044_21130 [Anaerolineae bacterium]|nr:tetratricopeptide repeat protein [Anaerolineales bacterium]